MKRIFVTGVEESGKDSILDIVLGGKHITSPRFTYLKLDKIVKKIVQKNSVNLESLRVDQFKTLRKDVNEYLEKVLSAEAKRNANVVINSSLLLRTDIGYLPVISADFFRRLNPDVLILYEIVIDENKVEYMLQKGHNDMDDLAERQKINREYALHCFSSSGPLLKIIKIEYGNLRESIKETQDFFENVLENG